MPKNNNNSNLVLEEYESEFSYQRPKSNLIISFNRVAFIFFVFLMISLIFSSKAIYFSPRNTIVFISLRSGASNSSAFGAAVKP